MNVPINTQLITPYGSVVTTPNYGSVVTGPNYASVVTGPNYGSVVTTPNYGSVVTGPNYASVVTGPNYGSVVTAPNYASVVTGPNYVAGTVYNDVNGGATVVNTPYDTQVLTPAQPQLFAPASYGYGCATNALGAGLAAPSVVTGPNYASVVTGPNYVAGAVYNDLNGGATVVNTPYDTQILTPTQTLNVRTAPYLGASWTTAPIRTATTRLVNNIDSFGNVNVVHDNSFNKAKSAY
jgi:hypothetical protein